MRFPTDCGMTAFIAFGVALLNPAAWCAGDQTCECCGEGYTAQATFGGGGELGPVHLCPGMGSQPNVEGTTLHCAWNPGQITEFMMTNYWDVDYCVNSSGDAHAFNSAVVISWEGAPGYQDPYLRMHFVVTGVQQPADGVVETYPLIGHCDEDPEEDCQVGDESSQAEVDVGIYYRYRTGEPPDGEILNKPGNLFIITPPWRYPDQIVSSGGDLHTFTSATWDFDDFESNLLSGGGSEAALWDDGSAVDLPAATDVKWSSSEGGNAVGFSAVFAAPAGGINAPVQWTVTLDEVDDDGETVLADDDPTADVDSVTYRVYLDHLARDIDNETALNNRIEAVCWAAANHAWDGSADGDIPPWQGGPSSVIIYQADPNPSVFPTTPLNLGAISRGDFMVLTGSTIYHGVTSVDGGGGTVWEYNGKSGSDFGTQSLQDYTLDETTYGERVVHQIVLYPHP